LFGLTFMIAVTTYLTSQSLIGAIGIQTWPGENAAVHVGKYVATEMVYVVTLVLAMLVSLIMLVMIKWSIYARFTGRSQLFSIQFIMWWLYRLLVQALSASSMTWIEGTEFMSLLLRVLGATVGNNVYFDTTPPIETDQLTIGNNVSILTSHQALVPHTLDRGMLQFSPITLGDDVTLGFNSCVMALATVEDGACVGPNSLISKGETVPRGAYAYGVPCSVLTQPLSTSYTEDGYEASPVFCEPQVCLQAHCDFDAELECSEPDASSTMPRVWAPAYSEKDVDSESERRPLLGDEDADLLSARLR